MQLGVCTKNNTPSCYLVKGLGDEEMGRWGDGEMGRILPPHHLTTSPPHYLTPSPPHYLTPSPPHYLITSPPHPPTLSSTQTLYGSNSPIWESHNHRSRGFSPAS
ncbi:hypothetical protein [Scytonema hofmannii]|uniref:hypothetical protein n=1 Tax=Scytonema hofmannii TaxID=34078 RepID=UPI000346AEE3|nr:hypothetical protein [Scytonema hofmannii]